MNKSEKSSCARCGKRLKKGGDNYRLECSIVSDFDGYLDPGASKRAPEELLDEINESGLTAQELEEQVYYSLKQRLCFDCRCRVIEFLKDIS